MMESDLFRKLCFGVKFSKHAESSVPVKRIDVVGEYSGDGADKGEREESTEMISGPKTESRKRKRKKKLGALEQKLQEVNTVKNRHRIHTEGESVPDPVERFEGLGQRYSLHPQLLRNIHRAGFTAPTPVQMQAMPVMMEGRDIMAGAPTGSGKTAAFVIPILHQLKSPDNQGFRALVLAPTRELAKQTLQVCRQLSEGMGFGCHYIDKPAKALRFKPNSKKHFDVLVSTPNRLVFLLKHDPPLIDLSRVQWLVVDESDKLFEDGDTGFQDQLAVIDNACSASGVRHAFFSATFSHDVKMFCQSTMDNVVQVNVGARNTATHLVKQELLFVGSEAGKRMAMRNLIREGITPPVLIFVQSKQRAKELYSEFMYDSIKVDVIHADKPQGERDVTVRNFMEGKVWALVCTELMGRGIDFKGIKLVINYDFPTNAISYIHRIGRTGRAGIPGRAITFFTEQDVTHLRSIANIMKESGCEVPEYMLKLKKPSKRDKKNKFPVKRKRITTVLHDDVRPAKRRKLTSDLQQTQATNGQQLTEKKHNNHRQKNSHRRQTRNHNKEQTDRHSKALSKTDRHSKAQSKTDRHSKAQSKTGRRWPAKTTKTGQQTKKKKKVPKTM